MQGGISNLVLLRIWQVGCLIQAFFRPSFNQQNAVTRGFLNALTRLVFDDEVQETISAQQIGRAHV